MNISISKRKGEAKVFFVVDNYQILGNPNISTDILNKLNYLVESNEFNKEKYKLSYLNDYINKERTIFIYVGSLNELNNEVMRRAAYYITKFVNEKSIKSLSIPFSDNAPISVSAL